jgi:hypothetical protein
MPSFTGSVICKKDHKESRVNGDWEKTTRGWAGGISSKAGKLPVGPYQLKIDGCGEVKISVTGRSQIPQAFIGVGPLPSPVKLYVHFCNVMVGLPGLTERRNRRVFSMFYGPGINFVLVNVMVASSAAKGASVNCDIPPSGFEIEYLKRDSFAPFHSVALWSISRWRTLSSRFQFNA